MLHRVKMHRFSMHFPLNCVVFSLPHFLQHTLKLYGYDASFIDIYSKAKHHTIQGKMYEETVHFHATHLWGAVKDRGLAEEDFALRLE